MRTNSWGLALIKKFESCKLASYKDGAGTWTIGWGSTRNVVPNMTITQEEADTRFLNDVSEAEEQVLRLIHVPLTDNQVSALVSFSFNEGCGRLATSDLLARINAGQFKAAATEFMHWIFVNGEPSLGLFNRRKAERELFLAP